MDKMTTTKNFSLRSIPYRVWLVLLLILWIGLLTAHHNTRIIRREKLRMDVSWKSSEVVLYEAAEGRDACRYMHLEDLQGFETKSDDWTAFSGGIASDARLASLTEQFSTLLLMDQIVNVQNGMVLFRDETPRGISSILNFTLAVYDAEHASLYYIEYNS